jgi:transcriptional regulator with XRE-family HTH domain
VSYRSTRPLIVRRRAEVGDRLRSLRRWRKLSQQRLGEIMGELDNGRTLDRRSISALENGHSGMTLDAILAIADVLKVPDTWLFSDDWTWPDGQGERDADGVLVTPPLRKPRPT